jgi:DNA-directed RNA polymerase subunit M/transcription elongation factor TFIIS
MIGTVVDFGCDFCREDQNRFYGHVTQIGSSDVLGRILMRCPRCGALYDNTPRGLDETRRLTAEQASELYPDAPVSATP